MDQLNAMRAFVGTARAGSFSVAAKEDGTTQGAVSKKIAALEKSLGAQLLVRNQRNVALTSVGREFYERSLVILKEVEEAETLVRSSVSSPAGVLRVTMSPVLSRLIIAPILADFSKAYRDVQVILKLTERHCDIIAEGIDIAIRVRHLDDSSLVALRLSSNPLTIVAAPSYLEQHGEPRHPQELQHHNCLLFSRFRHRHTWRFSRGNRDVVVPVTGNLRCDQGDTLVELAASGAGITLMPPWLMRDHLESGRLRRLLPGWKPPSIPLHIVYSKDANLALKNRLFVDFVKKEVRRRRLLPA
jgi:DNA-binding transcriptional LysR family regulator